MTNTFKNARNLSVEQKFHWVQLLESIISSLDLTDSQFEKIEKAYNGVGTWLSNSDDPLLKGAEIYSQGSVRLKTTVKPLGQDEFDVDLIIYLPNSGYVSKDLLMKAVKNRLQAHSIYKELMSELPRGFRINYKGDYHLDITPGKDHEHSWLKGHPLWVPDKREQWKESNAKGFSEWFDGISKLLPLRSTLKANRDNSSFESVEELPAQHLKSPLNRIVQILKRHRDEWAITENIEVSKYKPISVLITTLASRAYLEIINKHRVYDNDFDIILDVIEQMPKFIDTNPNFGYVVANPSMIQENYAEKWNREEKNEGEQLKNAFFTWHMQAINTFETLAKSTNQGLDTVFNSLSEAFGESPVNKTRDLMMNQLNQSRQNNKLAISHPTASIILASSVTASNVSANTFHGENTSLKTNTFFGKE